jgi:RNA polymerase sigma-70 factor (ECF subfamily)
MATPLPSSSSTEVDKAEAFRRLFQAELGYVWGSLRRLGVNERDVEDVAHDVFLQVYGKLDSYDRQRPLRPWLFGFAFRAASDYRRLARHRVEVMDGNDAVDVAAGAPLAEEALARAQEGALVMAALNQIDLDRRAVLIAYELDECPMREIAEALSVPLHTAYSRLRVAREELATVIRKQRMIAERRTGEQPS